MKVFVIGGFLGSGKTSILLQLARVLSTTETKAQRPRLVIVENEVGAVGIDNRIIESHGYLVETLTSGCACCTLIGELVYCLNKIAEHLSPEWLIVEMSGMGNTTTVVRTIERRVQGIHSVSSLIVVDADRYLDITEHMPGFLRGQIANADTIFLNKIDLLEEDKVNAMKKRISEINGQALLFPVCALTDIDETVWRRVVEQNEQLTFT